ncbi:hypothetical protein PR202_gb00163 [Eleusine coracana subsp. coracana]|uniref:DUF7950 domain-containing protein n=1 Tax=Eleusine coracana subsp. coracana TaxID=191504 RepID=A0AAV5DSX5_ELECO|nr:hypothetical protein QOZ80_5BG0433810 [Eleusine coracana subsp. coracana]GJN13456.1 hypothetical protein PR202_gb00163 [Eleusine coracana subsp. coracana]
MERKGGCLLVPRYGPTNGSGVAGQAPPPGVSWQMGRIMLKFRPIAPKPAAMAPAPSPAPVTAPTTAGRGKRKAAPGGGGSRRGRKSKKAATVSTAPVVVATKTVAGEKEEKEKSSSSRSSSSSAMTSVDSSPPPSQPQQQQPATTTLPLMPVEDTKPEAPAAALVTRAQPPPASWVTVENVTSMWRDGEAPTAAPCRDDAPAFVSDRWGRVTWANAGFTRALSPDEASVALAGALPAWGTCAGFTCRVRVRHGPSGQQRRAGVVAPCDVWRLDADGCYLWRLDLQAALTLGLGGGLP